MITPDLSYHCLSVSVVTSQPLKPPDTGLWVLVTLAPLGLPGHCPGPDLIGPASDPGLSLVTGVTRLASDWLSQG